MEDKVLPEKLKSPIFEAFSRSIDQQYIYICDVKRNVWRWSPYAVAYFNLPEEEIADFSDLWMERVHPEDRELVAYEFGQVLSGAVREHTCEYRVKNGRGQYIWVLCRGCLVADEQGEMNLCAGILTNMGQKSKFDAVTGLYSVHEFEAIFQHFPNDLDTVGGIMLFGIDHFRNINDTYQYAAGTALLQQYAKELVKLAPAEGCLYRLESDCFAMILPDANQEDMNRLFAEIQQIGSQGILVENRLISFSVTGGAVLYPDQVQHGDELHANLEYAFVDSKRNNRTGLTFFNHDLRTEALQRFQMEQKLRESVHVGFEGFSLHYQPIISADETLELVGAEALLRWYHPAYGLVSPVVFIPLLEECGDINEVGRWIVTTALEQVKCWHQKRPKMKISINVSFIQLQDKTFKHFVLQEIERLQFPKEQVLLELTESCKVIQPHKVSKELDFFRAHHIQIALDDFGTGYASLSNLRDLSADWIKVDHSFVAQIADNSFDQALTESLIGLCKKLGLSVCVEGIETAEIEQVIQSYRPTLLQGYYYSRPLNKEHFEALYIGK